MGSKPSAPCCVPPGRGGFSFPFENWPRNGSTREEILINLDFLETESHRWYASISWPSDEIRPNDDSTHLNDLWNLTRAAVTDANASNVQVLLVEAVEPLKGFSRRIIYSVTEGVRFWCVIAVCSRICMEGLLRLPQHFSDIRDIVSAKIIINSLKDMLLEVSYSGDYKGNISWTQADLQAGQQEIDYLSREAEAWRRGNGVTRCPFNIRAHSLVELLHAMDVKTDRSPNRRAEVDKKVLQADLEALAQTM